MKYCEHCRVIKGEKDNYCACCGNQLVLAQTCVCGTDLQYDYMNLRFLPFCPGCGKSSDILHLQPKDLHKPE